MLSRMLAIFSISLIFTDIAESMSALAKPSRQSLKGVRGFIPVYIRAGDTPLQDINPDLAQAFNFYEQKHNRITFGKSIRDKYDNVPIKSKVSEGIKMFDNAAVPLDQDLKPDMEDNKVILQNPKNDDPSSNIQKIPRH